MTTCREWKGSFWNHGYGYIRWNQKDCLAHRIVYEIVNGPVPKGFMVLHKCDNPSCVNPEHLYLGEALENAQDRDKRKRANLWFAITEEQRKEIHRLKGTMSQAAIAKKVGCSQSTVARWIDG